MSTRNYGLVESIGELERLVTRVLAAGTSIGFDIETGYHGEDTEKGSLRTEINLIAGVSFTCSTDWARYAPLGHDSGPNLDNYQAARLFWAMLASGRGVAHNAAFELRNLASWFRHQLWDDPDYGEAVRASSGYYQVRSCTQIESYLMAEYKQFGLKFLSKIMFGHEMTELHELFPNLAKNRRKYLRFNLLDQTDPKVYEYACEDSLWCLKIHERYFPQVSDRLLYKVDMGILPVICEMADHGLQFDYRFMSAGAEAVREFQSKFNAEIMIELAEMLAQRESTGNELVPVSPVAINLGSWRQVGDMLYSKLGMKTSVYTKSSKDLPAGQKVMSTGAIALAGLSKEYPVVKKILQHKEMTKLLGSYLDKYERVYGGVPDGRIHPNLSSALVITGRFACADPNVQASPKTYHFDLNVAADAHRRHAEAHGKDCTCEHPEFAPPPGSCFRFNFRDSIVAPAGCYILGFDLSQAELRAIAGEAQETALLEAFANGDDVHTLTASLMLGVPIGEVTKDQRAIGKTMNFALLYGMGVKSLSERLAVPREEAQKLYDDYFAVYSNIAVWSERQVRHGRKYGYVRSKFGRKLPIWEFQREERWMQQKGERACVNYPIQGAATGDYMRIAMVRARKAIHDAGLQDRVRLVMNVHDALEFYVDESVMPADLIKLLEPAVIFPVPDWPAMAADWHIAKKWGSPLDVYLDEQGRLMTKGKKQFEIVPTVEVDEETGEDEVVFPEEDVEAVRRVLSVPQQRQSQEDGKRLIVEVDDMPTADSYRQFRDLLDRLPGSNTVTLRTPQGELEIEQETGLDPVAHLGEVGLALGAVQIFIDASDVDASRIVEGLTL